MINKEGKEPVMVESNLEKEKKQKQLSDLEPSGKKRNRKSWKKEAEELKKQLDKDKKPAFTIEQVALITDGLFLVTEGLTKLPLLKVDPKLKEGFDRGLTDCGNAYLPDDLEKYTPVFTACTFLLLIINQAIEIRRDEKKKNVFKSFKRLEQEKEKEDVTDSFESIQTSDL